ncbi:MAG: heme ABC transporter ATP-binding protein [Pseudomonadota bacterium]
MSLTGEKLGFSVSDRTLLENVSLELQPGRVHAVLGPNGAGKSTLLRLLSGEHSIQNGAVRMNSRDLAAWNARERAQQRAVLPQGESLRFAFTAQQVVALGRLPCVQHGLQRETKIVKEALATAGVTHLAERVYPTLSGGERARVQFARVLVQIWEPVALGERFLLLDEPTASLDLAHQHSLLTTARRFAAGGVGVLAILHDPNLALGYADDVTLLKDGRLLAQGAATETLTTENLSALYGVEVRCLLSEGTAWLAVRPPGRQR